MATRQSTDVHIPGHRILRSLLVMGASVLVTACQGVIGLVSVPDGEAALTTRDSGSDAATSDAGSADSGIDATTDTGVDAGQAEPDAAVDAS